MSAIDDLVAKAECAELLQRARRAADDLDNAGYAKCFTDQGTWTRPGQPPITGRQAIEAFMSGRPATRMTRHFAGGIEVELHADGRATARSQLLLFGSAVPPALPAVLTGIEKVFEYVDELERTPEGWLIAARQTTVIFAAG